MGCSDSQEVADVSQIPVSPEFLPQDAGATSDNSCSLCNRFRDSAQPEEALDRSGIDSPDGSDKGITSYRIGQAHVTSGSDD